TVPRTPAMPHIAPVLLPRNRLTSIDRRLRRDGAKLGRLATIPARARARRPAATTRHLPATAGALEAATVRPQRIDAPPAAARLALRAFHHRRAWPRLRVRARPEAEVQIAPRQACDRGIRSSSSIW